MKTSDDAGLELLPGLTVERSAQPKCERCWRYTEDVGRECNYPTVCLRCADALSALHFPPYDAPNAPESNA